MTLEEMYKRYYELNAIPHKPLELRIEFQELAKKILIEMGKSS